MNKGAVVLLSLAACLGGCTVDTVPYGPNFDGYTVGYGSDDSLGNYGYNGYVGYGGWASNYYAPGNRYHGKPRPNYGGQY